MKIKTMLKRYAAENDCNVKDRMMLIIRIQRDGITIRDSAKSLWESQPRGATSGMSATWKWDLTGWLTCHAPAGPLW